VYFEVVTKMTPEEGVLYHGRFMTEEGQIVWTTPDRQDKQSVLNSIDLARAYAPDARVYEVNE
jgi:uncharacterized protein YegP (UPF0339 family)